MNFKLVESLIEVQKEQIAPGITIPTQVNFNISPSSLEAIISQRKSLQPIELSSELLSELRYYSLLQNKNISDFGLVFTTYYLDRYSEQQQPIAVIKSVIYYDGKISQQICRSLFQDVYLLKGLIISHYWLIKQICDRLSFQHRNKKSLLALIVSLILLLSFAAIIYFINISVFIKIIMLAIFFILIYWLIKLIINKYFFDFILQQLLFGFLSKNTARRNFAFRLIEYFS